MSSKLFFALCLTKSIYSSSVHSPYCLCRGSREDLSPCGLVSGQPGTFRAKPKNSNYASWLYSLSFFSFFFSPSFSLPPFFFPLLPALSQVHSNCSGFDRISVFPLHLTISHLPPSVLAHRRLPQLYLSAPQMFLRSIWSASWSS